MYIAYSATAKVMIFHLALVILTQHTSWSENEGHKTFPPKAWIVYGEVPWKTVAALDYWSQTSLTGPVTYSISNDVAEHLSYWDPMSGVSPLTTSDDVLTVVISDTSARRFNKISTSRDDEVGLAVEIASSIEKHQQLLLAEKAYRASPSRFNKEQLVKELSTLSPAFKRKDFRKLVKEVSEQSFFAPVSEESTLDELHYALMERLANAWARKDDLEMAKITEQFAIEINASPETRQLLEMHKYRFYALNGDLINSLRALNEIAQIAPNSDLAKRIPDFEKRITLKLSRSSK